MTSRRFAGSWERRSNTMASLRVLLLALLAIVLTIPATGQT